MKYRTSRNTTTVTAGGTFIHEHINPATEPEHRPPPASRIAWWVAEAKCGFDTEGQPCYRPLGHYGLHASEGHDSHCRDCGTCVCSPHEDCWVEDVGENEMVAVRLPRHTFVKDSV